MVGNVPELNGLGSWILFRPWRAVSRVSMVYQAGRFAYVEVHLLSFVKNDANFDKSVGSSARHALLLFTYLTLFFFLGVVVSGLVLTYSFWELSVRASQERDLLQCYGVKRTSVWVMWHCERHVFTILPCPPSSPLIAEVFFFIAATVSLIT